MYGEEKSDSLIVAAKQANNPKGAESVERRAGDQERGTATHAPDTEPGKHVTGCHACGKLRSSGRKNGLQHCSTCTQSKHWKPHSSPEQESGAGVDGIRWMDYAGNMKNNITDLHRRLHQGGQDSPAGVTTSQKRMENNARSASPRWRTKIVQYALVNPERSL
jgi:hypothetical protein